MDLAVAAYAFAGLLALGLFIYVWRATLADRIRKVVNRGRPDPNVGVPQRLRPVRFLGGPDQEEPSFDAGAFTGYVRQALENAKAVSGRPRGQMDVVMGMRIASERILDDFAGSPRSKPGAIQYLQGMIETSKMNKGRLPPDRKNVATGIEEMAASLIREINAGRFDQTVEETVEQDKAEAANAAIGVIGSAEATNLVAAA